MVRIFINGISFIRLCKHKIVFFLLPLMLSARFLGLLFLLNAEISTFKYVENPVENVNNRLDNFYS